jgi:hypothetical protein
MRIQHGGGQFRPNSWQNNPGTPAGQPAAPAADNNQPAAPQFDRGPGRSGWGRDRGGNQDRPPFSSGGVDPKTQFEATQNIRNRRGNGQNNNNNAPPVDNGEAPPPTEGANNPPSNITPSGDKLSLFGGGKNQAVLSNKSDKPMQVAVMKNPTSDNPVQKPEMVNLAPGQTVNVALPSNWSGRIYKQTGDGTKATLNELTFDGAGGQLFYNSSVIDGYNGPVTMTPTNAKASGNGRPVTVGSPKDITGQAPESMKIKNPDGSISLDGVHPVGDNAGNEANKNFYINALGRGTSYTYPKDDEASTRIVTDNSLNIDFF